MGTGLDLSDAANALEVAACVFAVSAFIAGWLRSRYVGSFISQKATPPLRSEPVENELMQPQDRTAALASIEGHLQVAEDTLQHGGVDLAAHYVDSAHTAMEAFGEFAKPSEAMRLAVLRVELSKIMLLGSPAALQQVIVATRSLLRS